ncbi:hypothetical protein, partial [Escherichia coli]|uniref:hypothetical protein n=1 Tax=Escherichia coli TaxID=562 RepID=UPI001BC86566
CTGVIFICMDNQCQFLILFMGHQWDTFYRRNSSKFIDMVNESSIQPLKNGAPGRSSSIFKNVASRS